VITAISPFRITHITSSAGEHHGTFTQAAHYPVLAIGEGDEVPRAIFLVRDDDGVPTWVSEADCLIAKPK